MNLVALPVAMKPVTFQSVQKSDGSLQRVKSQWQKYEKDGSETRIIMKYVQSEGVKRAEDEIHCVIMMECRFVCLQRTYKVSTALLHGEAMIGKSLKKLSFSPSTKKAWLMSFPVLSEAGEYRVMRKPLSELRVAVDLSESEFQHCHILPIESKCNDKGTPLSPVRVMSRSGTTFVLLRCFIERWFTTDQAFISFDLSDACTEALVSWLYVNELPCDVLSVECLLELVRFAHINMLHDLLMHCTQHALRVLNRATLIDLMSAAHHFGRGSTIVIQASVTLICDLVKQGNDQLVMSFIQQNPTLMKIVVEELAKSYI